MVSDRWRDEFGDEIKHADQHFRLVYVTNKPNEDDSKITTALKDTRIAVCRPDQLSAETRGALAHFLAAEEMKKNSAEQTRLFPIVRPVMEKVGSIVNRHIAGQKVDRLYLVGGTCAYPGMDKVIQEYTGIETVLPGNPLFVTPLGIAMNN